MEVLANVSAGNPWREKTLSFSPGKGMLSSPRGEKSSSFSFSSVKLFPDPRKSNNLRLTSPRAALGSVEQPPTFYDLLGITEDVSLRDIKQAYRQLARKYHPDVCPPERSEEYTRRFIEVQEAYETLTDPRRKNLYDTHIGGLSSRGSGSNPWNCSQEELAKEEWRSRWEVQLCNLKQKKDFDDGEQPLSWGARMREKIRNSSN